jgi:hypothetical protein
MPHTLEISPDGRRLFFARNKSFVVLEEPDWRIAWHLGTEDPILHAAFSFDGTRILAVRADWKGLDVLDASNGQRLGRLGKRGSYLSVPTWHRYIVDGDPVGRLLLSGDVAFETWDLAGIEAAGPDGIHLMHGDEAAPLVDVRLVPEFLCRKGCRKTARGVQVSDFSGDGRRLMVHMYREVRVYETGQFSETTRFLLPETMRRVRLAEGGGHILAVLDGEVHVWDLCDARYPRTRTTDYRGQQCCVNRESAAGQATARW